MDYAGNPSLARETKERIVTTYQQTLDLAQQGRVQEAALGCDFILKMDPLFSPARQLQDRLQGASGAVDLSGLPMVAHPAKDNGSSAPVAVAEPELEPAPVADVDTGAFEYVDQGEEPPVVVVPEASLDFAVEPAEASGPDTPPVGMPTLRMERPDFAGAPVPGAAPVATSAAGGGDRISELLAEGQGHFDAGDYQAAIDAWSRIFLIDIDHREAAARIEQARTLKAELERQIDQIFHEGMAHRDAGRLEDARASFLAVLERQHGHIAAREALERLDRPVAPPEETLPEYDSTLPPDAGHHVDEGAMFAGADPFEAPRPAVVRGARKPKRSFAVIGTFVFGLLAVGGWFVWDNRERLFPNAAAEPEVDQESRIDPIQQATRQYEIGLTQKAIDMLSEIPREDPNYDRAQKHIAEWRGSDDPESAPVAANVADTGAAESAQREALLERARAYYGDREYLLAAKTFRLAERIAPLDGAAADLFVDAKRQLLPIAQQMDLIREGEWELALPTLWRMYDQDSQNRDVRRLIADSYFNLGVRDLHHGRPNAAAESFAEVVRLSPDDMMAERLYMFSKSYETHPRDALYKIFVKLVQLRR